MAFSSAGSTHQALAPSLVAAALTAGLLTGAPASAAHDPQTSAAPAALASVAKPARLGPGNDAYTVDEDRVLSVKAPGVLRNDKAPRGQRYRVLRLGKIRNATATLTRKGALTVRPKAGWSGTIRTSYLVALPGGRPQRVRLTMRVVPVNDAPVFTPGPDQTVPFASGAQEVLRWATGIGPGAADERSQNVSFQTVAVADPNKFTPTGQPAVAPDGTLRYTPAPLASGSTTVTVRLVDDGGTTRGGANASPARTFTITLEPLLPDMPSDMPSILLPDVGVAMAGLPASGNVLTNDVDPDDVLTVASYEIGGVTYSAGTPALMLCCGPFALRADGSWDVLPTPGAIGEPVMVTYTTNTGSSSTLTLTVLPGIPTPPLP
jgi:hypothetical protein